MRKILSSLTLFVAFHAIAQEDNLRITLREGNPVEINTSDVKDITFVGDETPLDIVGEWFCVAENYGVFESLDFHEDGSIKYYYYYTNYHLGGTLTGTYSFEDYILKIKLPGMNVTTMPVVGHSETEFTELTAGSLFVYYKTQKTYYMTIKDSYISIGNPGDVVTYVDNVIIGLENNKIKPIKAGTGYALVMDAQLNTIVAYKVVVQKIPPTPIDWTKYFYKTKEDIATEFGTPDEIIQDDNVEDLLYYEYSADISHLIFSFKNNTDKVCQIQATFRTESYFQTYENYIKKNFYYNEAESTSEESVYYDTEDPLTATVIISVLNYYVQDIDHNVYTINFTSLE